MSEGGPLHPGSCGPSGEQTAWPVSHGPLPRFRFYRRALGGRGITEGTLTLPFPRQNVTNVSPGRAGMRVCDSLVSSKMFHEKGNPQGRGGRAGGQPKYSKTCTDARRRQSPEPNIKANTLDAKTPVFQTCSHLLNTSSKESSEFRKDRICSLSSFPWEKRRLPQRAPFG